jgi:type I restriction enzyme, S subunit
MQEHRLCPLSELVTFRGGGTPSTERAEFWNGEIPWVSPKDMKSDVIADTQDTITLQAINSSATSLIPEGASLVVVRSGILARTVPIAIAGRELALNQDIKALCPKPGLDARYLFYFLRSAESHLLQRVTRGATVHRLGTDDLRNLQIVVPSLAEQKRVVAILDLAFEGIANAAANTERSLRACLTI